MAASLQVVAKSGTVKKIKASDIIRTMGSDGCWFSDKASEVNVNDYISLESEEYIAIESGETVDLKFSPDTSEAAGQGTTIPTGLEKIMVKAVNGTCKRLKAEDAKITTLKKDAYASESATDLVVDQILQRGDMAVCNNLGTCYFTLRFQALAGFGPYYIIPVGSTYTDPR